MLDTKRPAKPESLSELSKKKPSFLHRYKQLFASRKYNDAVFYLSCFLMTALFVVAPDIARFGFGAAFWQRVADNLLLLLYSYITFLLLFLLLTLLVRKYAIAHFLTGFISYAAAYSNYFKVLYRGQPVLPGDILQLVDGIGTAETLRLKLSFFLIFYAVFGVLVSALLWFVKLPPLFSSGKGLKKLAVNLASIVLVVVLLVMSFGLVFFNRPFMEQSGFEGNSQNVLDIYDANLFFPAYFVMTQYVVPTKPADYSAATMADMAQQIADARAAQADMRDVDVIVLVVETWYDLDNYNATFSDDLLENYHRLAAEGYSGNIVSPLYGGGTANVEYEVLTGLSTSGATAGIISFYTDLYPDFPGIVNYYDSWNYQTYSIHAYTDALYNRVNAYPMLGFQTSLFQDDFENPVYAGSHISDPSTVQQILTTYRRAGVTDSPVFIHALTMQNHVPCERDIYPQSELVDVRNPSAGPLFQSYVPTVATAFRDTDRAIGMLCDGLRDVDRDVMVVVLGDHQSPIIGGEAENEVLTELGFYNQYDATRDFLQLHTTPYLVWTNFAQEQTGTFGNIPPNMLLPNALATYNVRRPAYFDYLRGNTTAMIGTTSDYVVNPDGSVSFAPTAEQQAQMHLRGLLQYDLVHGKRYLLDTLY